MEKYKPLTETINKDSKQVLEEDMLTDKIFTKALKFHGISETKIPGLLHSFTSLAHIANRNHGIIPLKLRELIEKYFQSVNE